MPSPIKPAPPLEPEAPPYVPKRYLVLETRSISWGGYVTTIGEGAVIDESGYTIEGIEKLKQQGVKLKPLE